MTLGINNTVKKLKILPVAASSYPAATGAAIKSHTSLFNIQKINEAAATHTILTVFGSNITLFSNSTIN